VVFTRPMIELSPQKASEMARGPKPIVEARTRKAQQSFLFYFRQHGNLTVACQQAKVDRRTPYRWYERNALGFRAAFDDAEQEAIEWIENELYRRAVTGVEESVYQGGQMVGTIRKFSDLLLIFMLKARAPAKYRDKFEGANLFATGAISNNLLLDKNEVASAIANMSEEQLKELAERGRKLPQIVEGELVVSGHSDG